jgi:hypothetical protein
MLLYHVCRFQLKFNGLMLKNSWCISKIFQDAARRQPSGAAATTQVSQNFIDKFSRIFLCGRNEALIYYCIAEYKQPARPLFTT